MKNILKIVNVLLLLMFLNVTVTAQFKFNESIVNDPKNHIIQGNDTSQVNWTTQYIEAKGWSVMDTTRFRIPGQAEAMARRGAILDAQRNLLERIKGVRIVGETVLKDMVTQKDYIYSRLDGVLVGAEMVGDHSVSGLIVEVRMQVPIYESKGKESVADVIHDIVDPNSESEKNIIGDVYDEQIGFRFNGEIIDPSLFPKIIDDDGNVVLDMSKYYNGKDGKFPKYLKMSKDIMEGTGFKKGVKIIDLIQDSNGVFKIDSKKFSGGKKINWPKVGRTVAQIGGVILKLVL